MAPPRSYHSPRRAAQARATRVAILESAERLFYERGYASTSIRQLALAAGVSEETVYAVFGDKPSILKAVGDRLGGDAESFADSRAGRAIAMEEDLGQRVRLAVRYGIELSRRGDFREIVGQAVAADPRLSDLADWADRHSYEATRELFDLTVRDVLEGRSRELANDLLWSLLSTQTIRRLTERRDWSVEATEAWLARLVEWVVDEAAEKTKDAAGTQSRHGSDD